MHLELSNGNSQFELSLGTNSQFSKFLKKFLCLQKIFQKKFQLEDFFFFQEMKKNHENFVILRKIFAIFSKKKQLN